MIYMRLALAIDILLVAVQHLSPGTTKSFLPLGGDAFIQLSALLLMGVAIHEVLSIRKDKK